MRLLLLIILSVLLVTPVRAKERTETVTIDGHTIVIKITENFGDVSTIRAECIIPSSHERVWQVITDYDHLEDIIPNLEDSEVIGKEDDLKIIRQKGRAGLWFYKRGFDVTLHVEEIPKVYVGFEAVDGDFELLTGTWQIASRDGGTWVAHVVKIEPRFYVPGWAKRKVARTIMTDTINGVIQRCVSTGTPPQ